MKLKIKTKYSLVILGVILSLSFIMGANMFFQSRSTLKEVIASGESAMEKQMFDQLQVRARLFAVYLADNLVNALYFSDLESIRFTLAPAMEQEDISQVLVFDAQGRIVHDSWGKSRVHEKILRDPVLKEFLSDHSIHMMVEDESFKIIAPINLEEEYLGGLMMTYSLTGLNRQIMEMRRELQNVEEEGFQKNLVSFLTLVSVFSLLAVAVGIRIAGGMARPIIQLSEWAKKTGRGEKNIIHAIERTDEIGELAESFKKMNEDLQQTMVSKFHMDHIIEAIQGSLVVVDPEQKIKRVNRAALDLSGYAEDELLGCLAETLFHDTDAFKKVIMGKLNQHEQVVNMEQVYRHADGRPIPVLFSGSSLYNSRKETEGYVFVANDLRERVRAEQKLNQYAVDLERSNKDLEDFAFIASHDLQEPLRKIVSFGERFKESANDKLKEKELFYLDRIESATLRMQKFIEDLLRYSRITTSTHRFRKIKLAHVAREAISVFELELERLNMVVEIGDLPSLEADKAQMYQLFQNLFSNALKFRKKERPLKIKVSSMKLEDGQFEIQVEDNGIGFDEKYLDKIFRPFERLHGRSAYEGSGIGLALCQKIVQKHGGDLYAKSQVGKGAIFIITLPEFSSGNKDSQDATLAQA
jgi:PAS domain S-box-containing protein